jgi:hypothetical protein
MKDKKTGAGYGKGNKIRGPIGPAGMKPGGLQRKKGPAPKSPAKGYKRRPPTAGGRSF